MTYSYQPASNFHEVFVQSLASNMLNANLTYDPASAAATMIETFKAAVAVTDGTSASMLNAGSNWLQNSSNYYSAMANTAAANAALTGNRIQANIAAVANNMAQRIAAEAADVRAAAANSTSSAAYASTVAQIAKIAGAAVYLAQIVDAAWNAPDSDQATVDALHSTAEAVGSLAGGSWGAALGSSLGAAFLGLTGLPLVLFGVAAAGLLGYGGGKIGGALFDAFLNGNARLVDATNTTYLASRTLRPRSDPLTLDLDGDGLETIGINPNAPILFDHNGDGVKTASGWVKPDDGFLVFDRNGNGSIDTGRELFGDSTLSYTGGTTADGFAALAQEDTNGDGLVNAADAHWSSLRVWRDLNQDGISQSGELFTLESQEIAALKVAKTANSQTLANGNQIADLGGYLKTDGSTGTLGEVTGMGDINLASNPFYSEFTDHITLTEAAQGIAGMQGAGMVRDLREAATLDASLVAMTNGLAGLTRSQMLSALDGLLTTWAGTSGMKTSIQDATSQGYLLKYLAPGMSNSDILTVLGLDGGGGTGGEPTPAEQARRAGLIAQMTHISQLIGVLERFNGTPFVTVGSTSVTTGTGAVIAEQTTPPNQTTGETSHYVFVPLNAGQLALLEQSYAQLKESVYGGLVMQTRLKPYLDAVTLSVDEGGVRLDFSAMEAANDFEWRVAA